MHFAVPVCAADEVAHLVRSGAGEMYAGVLDESWAASYGAHDSVSRRQGRANHSSLSALAETVSEARAHRRDVYLTLNARYTERQYQEVLSLAEAFEAMGGAGLQIAELGVIHELYKRKTTLKLSLSLLAVAMNKPTLAFYRDMGVSRVVLPRCLTAEQMGEALDGSDMDAEAMVMLDQCRFIDGFCRFYHGVGYADAPENAECAQGISSFDTTFREHACARLPGGVRNRAACAACALPALARAGVTVGKIGGRGLPLTDRLNALDFLRRASALTRDEAREALYQARYGGVCRCYYEAR